MNLSKIKKTRRDMEYNKEIKIWKLCDQATDRPKEIVVEENRMYIHFPSL